MTTTDQFVFFYSGREVFSNWHTTPGQLKDLTTRFTFDSTEQAFMWCKAWFFKDLGSMEAIHDQRDPREVKALGRLIKGYDDPAWETVREGFMTYVNLLKYRQNRAFAELLKSTGDRILIEASPVDAIWGVGLDEAACIKHAENSTFLGASLTWPGRNLLGKALMTVRGLL